MNKKNLLQGLLLLIVSLTLAIVGILWFYPENGRNFSGMLVFEQTSNRGADMDKVVISNGKNKVILTLPGRFLADTRSRKRLLCQLCPFQRLIYEHEPEPVFYRN